jgi:hypothetical protein
MQQVVKFPESSDFDGLDGSFLTALRAHENYIEAEKRRLRYEPSITAPEWVSGDSVISVVLPEKPDHEKMKVAVNNLVGYATHLGKRIVRSWRGMRDGEWHLIAEIN